MYIAAAILLVVPALLARQGSGSRSVWLGGGGLFFVIFALGIASGVFGGPEARIPDGVFHSMTEMLIGVRMWMFIGALGFMLAGFFCKQESEIHGLLGR